METRPTRILLVEDDSEQAGLIRKMLAKTENGFTVDWVSQLSQGLVLLDQGGIDAVILDLSLPDSEGLNTFISAHKHQPRVPYVVLTGLADEKLGLAAVRQGAQDYLIKGQVDGPLLSRSLRYAIERCRSQAALLAERRRLYALLDALPAAIYLKAPDHTIRFANRGFLVLFGSPEGRRCYEIFHGRSEPCEVCPAVEVSRNQKCHIWEWSWPEKGTTFQVQYHPFSDLDGSPLILTLGQDITESKRLEEALRADEQFLEDIFNSIQDGLSILDLDRRIIRVNPAMRKFPCSEPMEGRKCFEVYHGKNRPCEPCPVTHTLKTGETSYGQVEVRDKLGARKFNEIYSYPLINHANGELQGVIEYVRDVTERRLAEEALKESEQKLRYLASQLLTAQEDERRRLSQELHDELGHALLSMKLDVRAMAKQLLPEETGLAENLVELTNYIDEVIENVRRLYLNLTPGDLEDLGLTAALRNLCEEFGRHQEQISWSVQVENIDDLFPIRVQTGIYRIFQEILTNIGKHADSTRVSVRVATQKDCASFNIKDNGRGFDSHQGWQSSPKAGMGLLALEERIHILGGDVRVWSRKNRGTDITFTIPLEPDACRQSAAD